MTTYIAPGQEYNAKSNPNLPYAHEVFVGDFNVAIGEGDCAFYVQPEEGIAGVRRGVCSLFLNGMAVVVRGFAPMDTTIILNSETCLPYVNGCSTKQIIPPPRPGDPSLQMLRIPAGSSEQAHHIHSTARVVYVLEGEGKSIVGMEDNAVSHDLSPGTVVDLPAMVPHHFVTGPDADLVVLPVHVWSSTPSELHHPMFTGTHLA